MKLSKLFVGLAAALVLSACGSTAPAEHTITFNYNYNYGEVVEGEPAPTTIKVRDGQTVSAEDIPTPTRTDGEWAFKRWCTTAACTNAFDWTKAIEKDYTVYADWVDLTNCDVLTVVGGFGGTDQWNPSSDTYKLTTTDGIHYVLDSIQIAQYTEFQVIKNHAWDGQMNVTAVDDTTSTDIYGGTGNIIALKSAYYKVEVDLSAVKPVHLSIVEEYDDPNAAAGFSVYLVGDAFTGAAWAVNEAGKMEGPATGIGTWTKTITLNEGGQLKIIVKAVNAQGAEVGGDIWVGAGALSTMPEGWSGTDNILVTAGTYTITYTITSVPAMGTMTVTAA